jgi:hypothetical protein
MNRAFLAAVAAVSTLAAAPAIAAPVATATSNRAGNSPYITVDAGENTGTFGDTGASGTFLDTFTFYLDNPNEVTSSIVSIAFGLNNKNIVFNPSQVTLNGQTFTSVSTGLVDTWIYTGALNYGSTANVIKVGGTVLGNTSATSKIASYSGTLELQPVPEPGEWAIMLAGMGAVAAAAYMSRRKASVRFA